MLAGTVLFWVVLAATAAPPHVRESGPAVSGSCGEASGDVPRSTALRGSDTGTRLERLVRTGVSKSPTFAALLTALNQSDVIVYVTFARSPMLKAYLPHTVRVGGCHRYLRIVVRIALSDRELLPVLAHELQHVVEVAQAVEVRDSIAVEALFDRIGTATVKGVHVRETDAALRVQQRVRTELRD